MLSQGHAGTTAKPCFDTLTSRTAIKAGRPAVWPPPGHWGPRRHHQAPSRGSATPSLLSAAGPLRAAPRRSLVLRRRRGVQQACADIEQHFRTPRPAWGLGAFRGDRIAYLHGLLHADWARAQQDGLHCHPPSSPAFGRAGTRIRPYHVPLRRPVTGSPDPNSSWRSCACETRHNAPHALPPLRCSPGAGGTATSDLEASRGGLAPPRPTARHPRACGRPFCGIYGGRILPLARWRGLWGLGGEEGHRGTRPAAAAAAVLPRSLPEAAEAAPHAATVPRGLSCLEPMPGSCVRVPGGVAPPTVGGWGGPCRQHAASALQKYLAHCWELARETSPHLPTILCCPTSELCQGPLAAPANPVASLRCE